MVSITISCSDRFVELFVQRTRTPSLWPAASHRYLKDRVRADRALKDIATAECLEQRSPALAETLAPRSSRPPADGHTLLLANTANAINATLYDKLSFNFIRDITPVASIIRQPFAMLVHPSVPARSVPEFIAYAKANPGKLSLAPAGNGTGTHVAGELFKMMAGVDMTHVPYRGAGAMTDLIAGQVQIMFIVPVAAIEHAKAGKLRALAVTTATRSKLLPDIPTVSDFVPGCEASGWHGVGAPTNTSRETVETLNKEVNVASPIPK